MAEKIITIDQLRVGMYVIVPTDQGKAAPSPEQFRITSEAQIRDLRQRGVEQVQVDLAESHLSWGSRSQKVPLAPANDSWTAKNLVPRQLNEAIEDSKLPPEEKSKAVYEHSREMMTRLLESPTTENIVESKKAIGSIADLILADGPTAAHLLNITHHDFYTYTHSVNVGVMGLLLAKEMFAGSDAHDLQELGAGFFLHDLGKVMVPSDIINKPGRLTEEEMRRMRIHPYQGYKLLEQAGALTEECRIIVMQHHENADGSGYPGRLKGDQIHLYGRICGIVDVFDALTAERSYKAAMKPYDALNLMKEKMLHRFDEALFQGFVKMFEKNRKYLK